METIKDEMVLDSERFDTLNIFDEYQITFIFETNHTQRNHTKAKLSFYTSSQEWKS